RNDSQVAGYDKGRAGEGLAHASPAIRRFARELGVEVAQVRGSGEKGRVTKEDVQSFVKAALAQPRGTAGGIGLRVAEMPVVDFARFGAVEARPLSRIQKLSGANLHRNWVSIPHVTQFEEADITEMEAFRKQLGTEYAAQGIKITPLAFLLRAVVEALQQFPDFNASLDAGGENLILKKYFHIGVAVDTPDGLVVPVLRDVGCKGIVQLARELAEISARARDKKLTAAEMQGGCFTISSLGGIGGTAFTPIINAPEVAILGVSRSSMKPVWKDGKFEPRLMLPLSLSYDHRVIDGASAARFIVYLAQTLADIRRLAL
ncbi:MAG: 2-oxo acid dehydrogenase subunit E2, partial [Solirubrobacteraceae bacterium]|nr:2-oxo acid dehydrogenase subunit E2 [Solirubrobacteraceae bacterium]